MKIIYILKSTEQNDYMVIGGNGEEGSTLTLHSE
jgi:hypothetical protein